MLPRKVFVIILVIALTVPSAIGGKNGHLENPHKLDGTGGCIYSQPVENGPFPFPLEELEQELEEKANELYPGASGPRNTKWKTVFIEKMPNQITVYDRHGNVMERVHYWETGCRMIVEKCRLKGDVCEPGSGEKWRFGGCNWTTGTICEPQKDDRFHGQWVQWPSVQHPRTVNCAHFQAR